MEFLQRYNNGNSVMIAQRICMFGVLLSNHSYETNLHCDSQMYLLAILSKRDSNEIAVPSKI